MAASLRPIVLSVKAKNWRMADDSAAEADAEFAAVRRKALERDDWTCQFCGFRSLKWQEVHHVNDDHADNRRDNLVTACIFCHLCQHVGFAGLRREAVLVWLPEIPQARLNHLVRTVLVAWRSADAAGAAGADRPGPPMPGARMKEEQQKLFRAMAQGAQALHAGLMARQDEAARRYGTSDLSEFGKLLQLMPDDVYARRADWCAGLRLLPVGSRKRGSEEAMPQIVDSWREPGGPYAGLKPSAWLGLVPPGAVRAA
jgi:intracellular multiplication protein IcmJ